MAFFGMFASYTVFILDKKAIQYFDNAVFSFQACAPF